ncbi:ZZ-type zinc finger-containing protein 3 isoform X2 [Hyperolius riggenbachi]|uniref:ZZ-type zinc finger-containing protein 3 isoform X2 n=1 Tax=Hyperolius riggenbachi TaxID=752182 RepID=UPI0035A268FA
MAASRSTRVTRSTVGFNGLDESFCGRTLRNRSIAHPDEVVPPALLRSRSPKKRPESAQIQKGIVAKGSELKQPGPRESWVSPRKRGLSVSEKDVVEKDSVENADKKSSGPLSPVLKKIRRYLRSEDPGSPEEEVPSTFHKESSERRNSESDNETDTSRSKRANRCVLLDDSNQRQVKTDTESEELLKKSSADGGGFNHQIVNGIDNNETAAVKCNNCSPDGSIKPSNTSTFGPLGELTVSENGSTLAPCSIPGNKEKDNLPDHNVPCTHSEEQADNKDHELLSNCLPIDHINQTNEMAGGSCTETLLIVRDSEEELDVVGDDVTKEQAALSPNNVPNPDEDKPLCEDDFSLSDMPSFELCFSDTQEHRYTLRTSPRKSASVKDSPSVNDSPCGENGQAEEAARGGSIFSTSVNGSVTNLEEAALTDKKQNCPSMKYSQEKPASCPSSSVPPAKESGSGQPAEEEEEEPDVYFFESDHVALKHNKDYQRLLQTISVLEAQRAQAVLDVERLTTQQKEALTDPIGFVEDLQKKMDLGIPRPQRIVQLPEISWDQYTSALGNFEREFRNRKRNSRRVKLIFDKAGLHANSQRAGDKDGEPSSYSVLPQSDSQDSSATSASQVRGRLCTETKPGTFNQLWTVEEQKKLEQLLLKYPPEEVESKRWQKIADGLGNRTAKQVASRVQKYFIKLTKAGIPVPGRTPNLYMYSKKPPSKRQHILNKHLFKPSTFMTSHEPPVFMEEDDDHSSFRDTAADEDDEVSDDESIPTAYRELPEYRELLELKKLKKQRLHEMETESGFVQHVGFKCDNCGIEPIQGIRWHCQDCPQDMSVDFCDSCSDCLYETETHKESHHLEPVYKAETFLDRDYCMPRGTSYNYLDPNYFPANR